MKNIIVMLCVVLLASLAFAGVTNISEPKQPFEELAATVDFSKRLVSGDNVTSCVVTGRDQATGTVMTDNIVTVDNAWAGQTVSYVYKGGEDGGTYKITFRCTSQDNVKVEQDVIFSVREY